MQVVRWSEWKPALRVTHLDLSCQSCDFPGPLMMRNGKTRQAGSWLLTHVAFLCPECDEELVYGYSTSWAGELVEMPDLGRPARFSQQALPFPIPDGGAS